VVKLGCGIRWASSKLVGVLRELDAERRGEMSKGSSFDCHSETRHKTRDESWSQPGTHLNAAANAKRQPAEGRGSTQSVALVLLWEISGPSRQALRDCG
jgi:hypothetical protein